MNVNDKETVARAEQLRRMMTDYLRNMSDAERDRMLQVHLAQARGGLLNAELMRRMTAFILRARAAQHTKEGEQNE